MGHFRGVAHDPNAVAGSINGLITPGTGISITGGGTAVSPYVIGSTEVPGGPINAIQFQNPLGTFAGSADFLWNDTTKTETLGGTNPTLYFKGGTTTPYIKWDNPTDYQGLRFISGSSEVARIQDTGTIYAGNYFTYGGMILDNFYVTRGFTGGGMNCGADNSIQFGTQYGAYGGAGGPEWARFDPTGVLGIATTTPDTTLSIKLDINGSTKTRTIYMVNDYMLHGYGTNNYIKPVNGGTGNLEVYSDSFGLLFQTNSANRMFIANGGNVGIGTTSPTSLLHSVSSAAKTAAYTGVLHSVTDTSSTASVNKIGMDIESTGTWNGTTAVNTGLVVNATGGTTNYAATFSGGNVGIGTTAPGTKLMVIGTFGSDPANTTAGAGTRMFFDTRKAAFRAGNVTSTQWNDANVGIYSAAFGLNTRATARSSFAAGEGSSALATYSVALGNFSTVSAGADNSIAVGGAAADFPSCVVMGNSCYGGAAGAVALGAANEIYGDGGIAVGNTCVVNGQTGAAFGAYNISSGRSATVFGENSFANGDYAFAAGDTVKASGISSVALGRYANVSGDYSAALSLNNLASGMLPEVSGTGSLGIFMQDQHGKVISANNVVGIMGGSLVVDPANQATSISAVRSGIDFGRVTDAVILATGTTAQRGTGVDGMERLNTDLGDFEVYKGAWQPRGRPGILTPAAGISINAKTVANTLVYTVPVGKTCVVTGYVVRCTAASAITIGPSASVGTTAGGTDIAASQTMAVLTGTTNIFSWPIVGMSVSSTTSVYFNIGTASTGTSQTIAVDLIGYLV